VTFLAAAIAYYAFVSLIPALLLLVVVATAVFGEAIAVELLAAAAGDFLTPAGQEAVAGAISSAGGRTGASVIGVAVLLWSTLKVFRGLDTAFAELYGVKEPPDFVKQLADAASVVLAVSVGIGVMVAIGAFVAAADVVPAVEAASILVLPAFLAVVFLPMYYLLPEPDIGLRGPPRRGHRRRRLDAAAGRLSGVRRERRPVSGVRRYRRYLTARHVAVPRRRRRRRGRGSSTSSWPAATRRPLQAAPAGGGGPAIADAMDRQLQHDRDRSTGMNGESDGAGDAGDEERPAGAPDVAALQEEVSRLRTEFDAFEDDVERRTVDKPAVESELKRYVRSRRMRRGHARGWGPYLVLLYGTVLILGAFSFLDGLYAIAAMLILGLSTLGLYTLFIIVGIGLNLLETPAKRSITPAIGAMTDWTISS